MEVRPRPYAIEGKMYIIFGSHLIERFTLVAGDLFEVGWREARYFFKLR